MHLLTLFVEVKTNKDRIFGIGGMHLFTLFMELKIIRRTEIVGMGMGVNIIKQDRIISMECATSFFS
jgi:hypothetical protein